MAIAIVAIPAKDDRVWQLSSEKVPHLTLLFLGDQLNNQQHVAEFIKHAADNTFSKFAMIVDERGVLGDESADVLFFDKTYGQQVKRFRQHLLVNTDILTAYNGTEQYPSWIPHLTMGYPKTPAKPEKREYPGISSVHFDKIALWTGDYEGVEFPLKNDNSGELAMAEKGEAFLEHYGVKGMRWGVIRDNSRIVTKALGAGSKEAVKVGYNIAYKPSTDAKKAAHYMARAKLGGVRNLDNKEMQLVIQRMALEKQYKELYGERQWTTSGARWAGKFVTDVLRNTATSWLSNPFAKGSTSRDSYRTQAWANGQSFAGAINRPVRAIGRWPEEPM